MDLDPQAPDLDEETRKRRRALARMQKMSPQDLLDLAIRAGIYTSDGALAAPYRADADPSATRPED